MVGVRVVLIVVLWVVVEDLIVVGCGGEIEGINWGKRRIWIV